MAVQLDKTSLEGLPGESLFSLRTWLHSLGLQSWFLLDLPMT